MIQCSVIKDLFITLSQNIRSLFYVMAVLMGWENLNFVYFDFEWCKVNLIYDNLINDSELQVQKKKELMPFDLGVLGTPT